MFNFSSFFRKKSSSGILDIKVGDYFVLILKEPDKCDERIIHKKRQIVKLKNVHMHYDSNYKYSCLAFGEHEHDTNAWFSFYDLAILKYDANTLYQPLNEEEKILVL